MDGTLQAVVLAAMVTFFVTTVIFIVCVANKRRRLRQNRPRTRNGPTVPSLETPSMIISESQLFDPALTQIDMEELVKATHNFSADLIVGDGSFGLVYKAKLSNGVTVAVKRLSPYAFQGFRQFRAEMESLGKIRHTNIVQIFGYCVSGMDRVLIYEFLEKGSLDYWLYETSSTEESLSVSNPKLPLAWKTRINIVQGVARGLSFLHNLEIPIIHRDIKASNVLLDSDFEAHIADFGIARIIEGSHSHVSTEAAGTMGYMPPEYINVGTTKATLKGDVYSFGILMIEIATGIRPNWPIKNDGGKEIRLVDWATKMISQNREMEMVDASISKEGLKESEVVEFFRIATLCTIESPMSRHTMNDVVELLHGPSK